MTAPKVVKITRAEELRELGNLLREMPFPIRVSISRPQTSPQRRYMEVCIRYLSRWALNRVNATHDEFREWLLGEMMGTRPHQEELPNGEKITVFSRRSTREMDKAQISDLINSLHDWARDRDITLPSPEQADDLATDNPAYNAGDDKPE